MQSYSKKLSKLEVSTASFFTQILSKEEKSNSRSKDTYNKSKNKDNSITIMKLWYIRYNLESNNQRIIRRKKEEALGKIEIEEILKKFEKTTQASHQTIRQQI